MTPDDSPAGRSEWLLRCRVTEDGAMRWKSSSGMWSSEWNTRNVSPPAREPRGR